MQYLELLIVGGAMLVTFFALDFFLRLILPSIGSEYTKKDTIFRSFNDLRMLYVFVHPFALAAGFLYLRSLLLPLGFSNERIALVMWSLGALPGIAIDYSSFRISFKLALSWWACSALQLYAAARVISLSLV